MNDITAIKQLSYSDNAAMIDIFIAGQRIDINRCAEIGSIAQSLDYPNINRYRVGRFTITISDPDGDYSPNNTDNIFTQNDLSQTGYGSEVEIQAGFLQHRVTIFKGRIVEINTNAEEATTEIIAGNDLHRMHTDRITDFGQEKQFHLDAQDENSINGIYPIADWALPVSDESATVYKALNDPLTEVPQLNTQGFLDSDNYTITRRGVETEGGPADAASGYPQINYKAPFRHRKLENLIDDLLARVGVTEKEITIPDIGVGNHFSSNGRIGYSLAGTLATGSSNPLSWAGYTTDWIQDGTKKYILRNPPRGSINTLARLIEYDEETDTERILHTATSSTSHTTEFWKLAKNGNNIAIACTDAGFVPGDESELPELTTPRTGSYDASQSGSSSYILVVDITDGSTTSPLPSNSDLRLQLGHYYIFGETEGDFRSDELHSGILPQKPPFILPDTRRSFIFYENELYYAFVHPGPNVFGVAKVSLTGVSRAVVSLPMDGDANHLGFDFDIVDDVLYYAGVYKANASSRVFGDTLSL